MSTLPPITPALLREIAPVPAGKKAARQREITDALAAPLQAAMAEFGINTPLRAAHFLAQVAHESDSFCTLEEYASGAAYEERADLGNVEPGDGRRFKGRGPIQLTGRDNYQRFGRTLGVDLVGDPEWAADPAMGARIAALYWHVKGLNAVADRNDARAITRKINGGYNGLQERLAALGRAVLALGVDLGGAAPSASLLRLGAQGEDVRILQNRLNEAKYFVGKEDGQFGLRTDDGVRAFQRDHGLTVDGLVVVGGETWATLGDALAEGQRREVGPVRAADGIADLAQTGSRIAGSALRGVAATGSAVTASLGLVLGDAAQSYASWLAPLKTLTEPFGGPAKLALILLAVAAVYSAVQHMRAGQARAEDHRTGKTL